MNRDENGTLILNKEGSERIEFNLSPKKTKINTENIGNDLDVSISELFTPEEEEITTITVAE